MKIQPLDESLPPPTATKSRFKRLFEKQFLKSTSCAAAADTEPSSLCLDKMVVSFIEDNAASGGADAKPPATARNAGYNCNCFHRSSIFDSESDEDVDGASDADAADAVAAIKSLVPCTTLAERNLLADVTTIIGAQKSPAFRSKADLRRNVVTALRSADLEASICKSKWQKAPSFPSGEHEYIDVVINGDRLLVEVDFRTEFEMARSTKKYRAVLQMLPAVFVGREERLRLLVAAAAEAGRASMKKKGLSFPPWRRREYLLAKWLSPAYERQPPSPVQDNQAEVTKEETEREWELPPLRPKAASPAPAAMRGLAAVLRENSRE